MGRFGIHEDLRGREVMMKQKLWLGDRDSNPDSTGQSRVSYH